MTIAAFDAKQFRRGKPIIISEGNKQITKYVGFNSQLGAGIIVNEPLKFITHYTNINQELMKDFEIHNELPFFSSSHLKATLGISKAIVFADQLITKISKMIESIHCSYLILPPSTIPLVTVGGFKCPTTDIATNQFIDNLGPMFSYLTAHSYLWMRGYQNVSDLELYIDSFRSKPTKAWDMLIQKINPKIFIRGDECNPFISCADIIAFLTDVKLYTKHLKLEPNDIKKAWNEYDFDTTVQFFDQNCLQYYTWKSDAHIDFSNYLVKPTIFLAIDDIELERGDEAKLDITDQIDLSSNKPRKFNRVIKKSSVYYAALNYAIQKNGCMKIFSKAEDISLVRDGDVFIYVGTNSEKIGKSLQHGYNIEVYSGVEIRQIRKNV